MNSFTIDLPPYELAPILIATHTRLDHLTQTIDALKNNLWAISSDLYIASDAPRNNAEIEIINKIRNYIDTISGFKSVNKIIREVNYGHFENFQDATRRVFDNHNKIIKLEDDIVTGRYFLRYMNESLHLYSQDIRVMSVSGHLWDGLIFKGTKDTALLPASNGWGWGTWRDRFYLIDHSPEASQEFLKSPLLFWKMNITNPSLLGMVNASAQKKLIAGDVNWALHIIKYNKYVLFPKASLVKNIGFDGTGQNCHNDPRFSTQLVCDDIINVEALSEQDIRLNSKIIFKYFGGYKHILKQCTLYFIERVFGRNFLSHLLKIKRNLKAIKN